MSACQAAGKPPLIIDSLEKQTALENYVQTLGKGKF